MDVTIWVVDVIDVSLVLVMNKSQQGRARIYVNAQFVFSTQRNAAPAVDSDGRSCVVRHAQHNPVRSDKTDKWMYDCVGFGSPIQLNRNMIMQMIHTHRKKQYACFCLSLVQINPVREPLLSPTLPLLIKVLLLPCAPAHQFSGFQTKYLLHHRTTACVINHGLSGFHAFAPISPGRRKTDGLTAGLCSLRRNSKTATT